MVLLPRLSSMVKSWGGHREGGGRGVERLGSSPDRDKE